MAYNKERFWLMCNKIEELMDKEEADPDSLSRPEFICIQIWHSSGVIGNGGIPYFFERNISFEDTQISFEEIGYNKGVEVFKQVLEKFPGGTLPGQLKDVQDFINSNYDYFMHLSVGLFDSEDELNDKLYIYMIQHGLLEGNAF